MNKTNSKTDRQTGRGRAEREETGRRETGREVSSTEEGEMWEQEGGEIMLVAPVCLCAYVSVCIAHVSGYAAHRKQTATNPLHTRGKTTTHTRPIADTKKAKHTHTQTKPHSNSAQCTAVFSNVMYTHTHRFVHIRRTLPLHSKHTHSPTHMKNKHSHEIHPHMKTHTVLISHTQHCYHIKAFCLTETHLYVRHFLWGKRG